MAELKKRRGSLLSAKDKKKENDLVVKSNPIFGQSQQQQHGTLKTNRGSVVGLSEQVSGLKNSNSADAVTLGANLNPTSNENKMRHTRHGSIRAPKSSVSEHTSSILSALGIGENMAKLRLPISTSTFSFTPPSPKTSPTASASLPALPIQPITVTPPTPKSTEDANSSSSSSTSSSTTATDANQADGKRSQVPKMAKFVYQHNQEKVIREIILTEAAYVRDLKLLITLYVEPIRSKGVLTPEEITDIFSNVEMLFVINNTLLQKLLTAQQTGNNPVNEFLELKEYLKSVSYTHLTLPTILRV
eukprot:TRINITY_DN5864_c0_g1_i2.p1 TRINITY_DN5864_c0_g1~~TRINITY_DN5864_c0_g1_i2.p1  ORF type:complete len:303 (-),score=74.89 TRINITY_DN5864_c0_g1_i2:17-925(-)